MAKIVKITIRLNVFLTDAAAIFHSRQRVLACATQGIEIRPRWTSTVRVPIHVGIQSTITQRVARTLLAAYLSILEEENDVLRMYAGGENCWFEVSLEFLDPVVVRHVHANKC